MSDFQNASFVPFDYYVNKAKAKRPSQVTGSNRLMRHIDFADAVEVTVKEIDDVPDFALLFDEFPMELPEVTHLDVEVIDTADAMRVSAFIDAKIEKAKNIVAARAFTECIHAGYFPPRCQACGL